MPINGGWPLKRVPFQEDFYCIATDQNKKKKKKKKQFRLGDIFLFYKCV